MNIHIQLKVERVFDSARNRCYRPCPENCSEAAQRESRPPPRNPANPNAQVT